MEEKKGQLESHEIIHKEINSRNSLVHSVCSKAEEIMTKRGDQSLTDYVTSIRALFKSIAIKSQDLIGKNINSWYQANQKYGKIIGVSQVNHFTIFLF